MTTNELQSATPVAQSAPVVKLYLGIGLLVFAGLMLVGVLMRAAQGATMLTLAPDVFYQLMTLHGAGMVGTAGLAALAVNWYFLSQHVRLNPKIFLVTLLLSLVAVVMIVGSILIGHFAAAWTFLYPLPAFSLGLWSTGAALTFVGGLLVLGVAFLLVYLDMGVAIVRRYGSIARALGLPMLFGREPIDPTHSPTVVASAVVIIINVVGIAVGAIVLIMTMLHLIYPPLAPDALLMKNLIFFFGHVFINATIYSAVIAVYEILPLYARRPWRVSRPFLASWLAVTLMVMAVYPHHLLMDFAMPRWMAIMGQILSYTSGIPVLVVTAYGGLMLVYRSGIRWDAASSLLVLSLFGWAAGIIPAVIDGMIHVNLVMHNTLWVPGHFHFYLLLGVLPMVLGFASYLCANGQQGRTGLLGVAVYATSGTVLCLSLLVSGALSVPRRFAVHEESWQWLGNVGALSGGIVLIGTLMIAVPILLKLPRARLASTWTDAHA